MIQPPRLKNLAAHVDHRSRPARASGDAPLGGRLPGVCKGSACLLTDLPPQAKMGSLRAVLISLVRTALPWTCVLQCKGPVPTHSLVTVNRYWSTTSVTISVRPLPVSGTPNGRVTAQRVADVRPPDTTRSEDLVQPLNDVRTVRGSLRPLMEVSSTPPGRSSAPSPACSWLPTSGR